MKRILAIVLSVLTLAAALVGCGQNITNTSEDYSMVLSGSITNLSEVPKANLDALDASTQTAAPKAGDVVAIIHTNMGDISMRFFPEGAPIAVNNFIALAKAGKYDDTIFHRVINGFMIQGGDYTNFNGTGGESIYGEEFDLEISDYLLNIEGAVAMANRGPGSNGSQFYINQVNNNYLDGGYTVFAQVYDGMDVVNMIAAVQTDASDKPVEDVTITGIEITTFA